MYSISKHIWGYKIVFSGQVTPDEAAKWLAESKTTLSSQKGDFGVVVDMINLIPLVPDAGKIIQDGQKIYQNAGMKKSAVLLANSIVTMQFKRLAKESGIYAYERYIDVSKDTNYEQTAVAWITKGIDPDTK